MYMVFRFIQKRGGPPVIGPCWRCHKTMIDLNEVLKEFLSLTPSWSSNHCIKDRYLNGLNLVILNNARSFELTGAFDEQILHWLVKMHVLHFRTSKLPKPY